MHIIFKKKIWPFSFSESGRGNFHPKKSTKFNCMVDSGADLFDTMTFYFPSEKRIEAKIMKYQFSLFCEIFI